MSEKEKTILTIGLFAIVVLFVVFAPKRSETEMKELRIAPVETEVTNTVLPAVGTKTNQTVSTNITEESLNRLGLTMSKSVKVSVK